MNRADHLLCCAVSYKECSVPETPIENQFNSTEHAIKVMIDIMWFEARQSLNEPIETPEDPFLHPVDIDTDEPGIVASKTKLDIHRRKMPLPVIRYERQLPENSNCVVDETVPIEQAVKTAEKQNMLALKKQETKAKRDIIADEKTMVRKEEAERKKRERENETKEERQERLLQARQKREERKRKKEEEEACKEEHSVEMEASKTDDEKVDEKVDEKDEKVDANTVGAPIAINVRDILDMEDKETDASQGILPPKLKMRQTKLRFFKSPVPFDRHLAALQLCSPHDSLTPTLLQSTPSENVKIIHGPPGTGKTRYLVDLIPPTGRVLLCAPTNIGAANLYARAVHCGIECSLLISPSRIPSDMPITSQDPRCRVVASTISGRSGPLLINEAFEIIIVDEAAQCMEALIWGLLRAEVRQLIMAGDTEQLPALVSEDGQRLGYDRSLMHRLVEAKYPLTFLDVQRRMHPEILSFTNQYFYNSKVHSEYADRFKVNPYLLVECKGACKEVGTSFENVSECNIAVAQAFELKATFDKVIILCPYQAQCRRLLAFKSGIPVHTIDSFQGCEADAVVLSIVRTDTAGFWSDTRRMVVALTRARHCMRIIGDITKWKHEPLVNLRKDAIARKCVVYQKPA